MTLKRIYIVSISIICILLLVIIGLNISNKEELKKVYKIQDKTMSEYLYNKQVAIKIITLLSIHNKESMLKAKKDIIDNLSDKLKEDIFRGANWDNIEYPDLNIEFISIDGDIERYKEGYVYRVKLKIDGEDTIFLVTVDKGLIMNYERVY